MKEEVLASQNGMTVKFMGEQLNQSDLDVWETFVHVARQHPVGLNEKRLTAAAGWLGKLGGAKGGAARAAALSPRKRSAIAKKAALALWRK